MKNWDCAGRQITLKCTDMWNFDCENEELQVSHLSKVDMVSKKKIKRF